MRRFRRTDGPSFSMGSGECAPLVRLWILRMLVSLKASRKFITEDGFEHDGLAEYLGLQREAEAGGEFDGKAVHSELRALHRAAERGSHRLEGSVQLASNIERLSSLADLSETDRRILEFAVLVHTDEMLRETTDLLGTTLSTANLHFALAAVLGLPEREVREALSVRGTLARSGLVKVSRHGASNVSGKLELLSSEFADNLLSIHADPIELLRDMVVPAGAPELAIEDYAHITTSLSILQPYLKHALGNGRTGVNIFLHGTPGTGKSQLTRLLAHELHCELFEVTSEDEDGDPISGERRLRAFRAAQTFLSQRRSLILFDEVEDVFNDLDIGPSRKVVAQSHKGWLHRTLEENKVPTLWLSNATQGLDAALMRRFDMVIELPVPPRAQRERILRKACGDLLVPEVLGRLADSESLAPAVVTRAASVVRCVRKESPALDGSGAIEHLIAGTLQAQGHRLQSASPHDLLPSDYDPSLIHASADLAEVAAGLLRARGGRLCLYGPPGTGKSAYGRWLARQLDVPLHARRASDLMSKWVGESERNIARAFRSAAEEGAVLLIDEVDGFLQDRRSAGANWEVSLVNELLIQMESFAGIFVASTNLVDQLDPAAMRRFDLKVKFNYLMPEQVGRLLSRQCEALKLDAPTPAQLSRAMRLATLTPGDFAAVERRSRFHPMASVDGVLAALEAECEMKKAGARSAAGFLG